MNKEEQHIDQLFQSLKEDKFVAPQSFMDDLKLRVDAKAKLAARRKIILWFVLTSIVLVTLGSILIYTVQNHSADEANRRVSLTEVGLNANTDTLELKNINQNTAVRFDSAKLNTNQVVNEFNNQREEIGTKDLEDPDQKESSELSKQSQNSKRNKNNLSENRQGSTKKESNSTKSKVIFSKRTGKKLQKNQADLSENNVNVIRKSEASKKATLDSKGMSTSSAPAQNSNVKNSSKEQNQLIQAEKTNPPINSAISNQSASNNKDLVLQMRLKKPIDNPFNVSLVEQKLSLTNSNVTANKPNKNLEFNVEAYGGALFTSSKYNPTSSADGYKASPLFSPSFGIKTSLLYQNIYGSIGVEYFKSGDKQVFDTKTFTQIGVDSTQTVIYSDTIWIDSMTFVIDSLIDYQITPIFDSITNSNKVKNQYTWISIPLSFGYRFQYNSWDFIPNFGVNLNFGIAQNSGQYPDASNQLVKYNTLKFNMDIRIQTEVRKNFGKYYVFVSPYFKRNLKPIISYPGLRLTQNNWGLNGGFGMKF